MFNEKADRASEAAQPIKPKNILEAIMGNPAQDALTAPEKKLIFDEAHYNKFEREAIDGTTNNDETATRRRRQNPLGDFKFKRINELF